LLLTGHGSVFMVLADDAQLPRLGSGFNSFALAYNLDSEADVDMRMNEVVAAGTELFKPPRKVFRGSYSGYLKILMAIFGNWHTIPLRGLARRTRPPLRDYQH